MHHNNVIHRDIKPQNILCGHDDTTLISDFSLSIILGKDGRFKLDEGTPYFLAPE